MAERAFAAPHYRHGQGVAHQAVGILEGATGQVAAAEPADCDFDVAGRLHACIEPDPVSSRDLLADEHPVLCR